MKSKSKRIKELEEELEKAKFVIRVLEKSNEELRRENGELRNQRPS